MTWIRLLVMIVTLASGMWCWGAQASVNTDAPECSALDGYLDDLGDVSEELRDQYPVDDIKAAFDADDDSFVILIAEYYKDYVDGLRSIDPPDIARGWHRARIAQMETTARVWKYAIRYDLWEAVIKYEKRIDRTDAKAEESQIELVDTCPTFLERLNQVDDIGDTFVDDRDQ